MAKEYTTKDGKKILGWYRRGGKAIPIIEGQVRKGEGKQRAYYHKNKEGNSYVDYNNSDELKKGVAEQKKKGRDLITTEKANVASAKMKSGKVSAVQKNAPKAKRDEERLAKKAGAPRTTPKETAKERAERQHAEHMAKQDRMNANKPSHVKEYEREKFIKDYYDTMMKAGKTADKVRKWGNDAQWNAAIAENDDDRKKWQNYSNKTEDVARFIEGREPVARIASKLIDKAKSHADEVTKDLQDSLKGDAGSVDRGLPFRTKGQDSMHRKLREKALSKGLQPEQYAEKVTDALRFTDMVDADNYVGSFNKLKKGLEDRGYEMVEVENTIHKKGEKYRGLNTLVESPKGYTFELQFHTPESFDVKEVNHKDYEVERRLTTSAEEKERLSKQMADRANKIQTPKGAETIQDVPRHKRKGPSDSAIRNVMEERGMTRTEAVLYLKKKNKYE